MKINQFAIWIFLHKMYSLPQIKCWEMVETKSQLLVPTQVFDCPMGLPFKPLFSPFPNILLMVDYSVFEPMWKRSMTFSYFVLYFDKPTSHRYHVIDFYTPYNTVCPRKNGYGRISGHIYKRVRHIYNFIFDLIFLLPCKISCESIK